MEWTREMQFYSIAGDTPKPSKDTQHVLACGTDIKSMLWCASTVSSEETTMTVKIQTGCDAIIGKWKFIVSKYRFLHWR